MSDGPAPDDEPRRLPGFREMAARRRELIAELTEERRSAGLSQTEIAARMGTSQSAVARLESGDGDLRMSTLERYAAALGRPIHWRLAGRPEGGTQGRTEPDGSRG